MIDADGDYILKGSSFKNSSFFEFYRSYNPVESAAAQELFGEITSSTGSLSMLNSHKEESRLAFTPVASTDGWTLLSIVPAKDLNVDIGNWLLICVISAGLLILFLFDLSYMLQLNKRLKLAAREAESASKAKTDFLSTMSHDIRTPMNAILGLTTIAEKNLDDPEATGESLRKISLAGNHLLTLINDILDISKVESGNLSLSPLTFSIVETVENLVNLSQPMVKEKNIDFSFNVDRMEKEYLYADQLRLNQITINLLSNAIKYTEPGGKVSVDLSEEESAEPGCVKLVYRVADTGIGMTPEFMETMYEPFSRQTDSRVNSIQGTGLGLAITKQMIDLMGGTIDCQSEPGKGTTFTVSLDIPVADRQREDMQFEPIDVLIVDDDEVMLRTAVDTLESLGATAEQARSGMEALGMIEHRHLSGKNYGVVIVDWRMPDMDGIETIKRIHSDIDADIPVLLISAYDWSDIEDKAKEAGANGFVSKPLFRSTLYDKINDLIGKESKSLEPEDDYSDLQGLHILVAEDNDINWEIISAMLAMFGITTDRAANGRICVDMMSKAEKGSYELIFMDVQMPEMNGLDATVAIRKLEDPWASSIPIIAMTADAFSENITACLNAGMNGHIAKPVDIKLVIKEIRRIKEERKES
jgi:signal transduction histidine kinase/CheY-like chemotaxis protein